MTERETKTVPLDDGDIEWLQGVASACIREDNILSVGRAQRILDALTAAPSQPAEPKIKVDTRPKKSGWAPGDYHQFCHICQCEFVGDKRAVTCADCAYGQLAEPDELARLRSKVAELEARIDEARKLLMTYRHQTPLGHQPHMIAGAADKWLNPSKWVKL